MGLVLYIVSLIGSLIFLVTGVVYGIIRSFVKVHLITGLRRTDNKFRDMATMIDRVGNVFAPEILNDLLLKPDSPHKFGDYKETLSEVFGHNQHTGHLRKHGWFWVRFLNRVEKDHCLKSAGYVDHPV